VVPGPERRTLHTVRPQRLEDSTIDRTELDKLALYLARVRPGLLRAPLQATMIAGGRSNITYVITDVDGEERILRRPPLGHVLSTAHDMAREFRVIEALRDTAVPVPMADLMCSDLEVIGAPFYIMQRVAGTPYRLAADLALIGPKRTAVICDRMLDALVALQAVDPLTVGLGDFGLPNGFLARQVRRWKKQLDASHTRDLTGLDELHTWLEASVPVESAISIVHGDFRLDNLLDQVTAVLDWEMATLGDPLLDIALLLAYNEAALGGFAVGNDAPLARGYPTSTELLESYTRKSGRDTKAIGFYLGLAYFKMAGILEGIHYRYLQGQTVGDGFDEIGRRVPPTIAAGLTAVAALGQAWRRQTDGL
jgi:aminoglycoside phosphotransferase (APT) family kinase protein